MLLFSKNNTKSKHPAGCGIGPNNSAGCGICHNFLAGFGIRTPPSGAPFKFDVHMHLLAGRNEKVGRRDAHNKILTRNVGNLHIPSNEP